MKLDKIKWCNYCVLPNTRPNLFINSRGICNSFESSFEKKYKVKLNKRK